MLRGVKLVLLAAVAVALSAGAQAQTRWPGIQADGSVLLHNQWAIHPAGRQVPLNGTMPDNVAIHPKGHFAAVLDCGYGQHELVIVDIDSAAIVARAPVSTSFYGLAFSADGKHLFCSGGSDEAIHRFDFSNGNITNETRIRVHDKTLRAVPCGFALNRAATKLFVANVWGNCVSAVDVGTTTNVTDLSVGSRPAHLVMAPIIPPEDFETFAADKRSEVGFYSADPEDTFPYGCCLDERRQRLYVSLWGQASVKVIDLTSGAMTNWPAEAHPCEMALTRNGRTLYVANANRNTVTVFDTGAGALRETIWAAFHPGDPPGATPNSLALSPDDKMLFVANANINAIAVFDVAKAGHSRSLGFIPTGWYPTSVRVTPDGRHLVVANSKGGGSKPNPYAAKPNEKKNGEYIASLLQGSVSIIDIPRGRKLEEQMPAWTAQVFLNSPLKADAAVTGAAPAGCPIPARVGDSSPIKYVIYVIKENRTFDQVLGDMPEGNGDAGICLFPERVTPNHHQLARDFVLLDNTYADATVSSDGHEWSMGAMASDFVEKMWPMNYGHNRDGKFPYPSEGYFPIAAPGGGYLWDRAAAAGVTYRSYGEFVSYDQPPDQPCRPRVKSLAGHIDPGYRGFDLKYSDMDRMKRFTAEFNRLLAADEMPRLQIVRLPSDHTHGTSASVRTPSAFVAENDLALGQLVDLVSHSKIWPETAIFVIEDDAQSGADHVDAHRTIAFAISPYTRHQKTDSTMYSTSSMLRTIELILGLQPMTQFDAAATPMFASFAARPDAQPYTVLPANIDIKEKNKQTAWGSSLKMDFSREDAADDFLLNEAIWKSVRGNDSPMPAPVHAAFVFTRQSDDD
jgi:DNA-binding beta-propeller fold protein YncE